MQVHQYLADVDFQTGILSFDVAEEVFLVFGKTG